MTNQDNVLKPLQQEYFMFRRESEKQMKIEDFSMPFGGMLSEDKRWIKDG